MTDASRVCPHCGSTRIVKHRRFESAEVQREDIKTGRPIGDPIKYLMYECLSCGKDIPIAIQGTPYN